MLHWDHSFLSCRLLVASKPQGMCTQRLRGENGRDYCLPSSPKLELTVSDITNYPHPEGSEHYIFRKARPTHRIDKFTGIIIQCS